MATPTIGETAANFELPDGNGTPWVLGEQLAVGPVVLLFYRGDW